MLVLAHNPSHQACRRRMINSSSKQFCVIYLPCYVLFCIRAIFSVHVAAYRFAQCTAIFFHIPWRCIKDIRVIQRASGHTIPASTKSVASSLPLLMVTNQLLVPSWTETGKCVLPVGCRYMCSENHMSCVLFEVLPSIFNGAPLGIHLCSRRFYFNTANQTFHKTGHIEPDSNMHHNTTATGFERPH